MRPRLLIQRHAEASDPFATSDHGRPLTDAGRAHALQVGEALAVRGWVPDHVLCSSALRTRQTLQAVEAGLGVALQAVFSDDLYRANFGVFQSMIREAVASETGLWLVCAHNPNCSEIHGAWAGQAIRVPPGRLVAYADDLHTVIDVIG
jgi:phosphohistidine phosphatase